MFHVNVIDETFDVSLGINLSDIVSLESQMHARSQYNRAPTDSTCSSIHSTATSYSTAATSFQVFLLPSQSYQNTPEPLDALSPIPSVAGILGSIDSAIESAAPVEIPGIRLPAYIPPPEQTLVALSHVNNVLRMGYTIDLATLVRSRPQVPQVKTNTNLCNYVHRLYLYKVFLQRQIEIQAHQQQSRLTSSVTLRHRYDPSLSRTMSRRLTTRANNEPSFN